MKIKGIDSFLIQQRHFNVILLRVDIVKLYQEIKWQDCKRLC